MNRQLLILALSFQLAIPQANAGDPPYIAWCKSNDPKDKAACNTAYKYCNLSRGVLGVNEATTWCKGGPGPGWRNYPTYQSLCCGAGEELVGCDPKQPVCLDKRAVLAEENRKKLEELMRELQLLDEHAARLRAISESAFRGAIGLTTVSAGLAAHIAYCKALKAIEASCLAARNKRCVERVLQVAIETGCPTTEGAGWLQPPTIR